MGSLTQKCARLAWRPLGLAAACLGACTTVAPTPTEPEMSEHYELFGVVAHHTPREEADPELLAIWSELDALLASTLNDPEVALADDPSRFASLLQAFTSRIQSLAMRLEALATRGEDDRIFAALATGALFEHLALEISAMPSPSTVRGNAEIEALFRHALNEQAGGIAERALPAYEFCSRQASDGRAEVCSSRVEVLSPLIAAAADSPPPRIPASQPLRAATGPLPEGCGSRSSSNDFTDPEAASSDSATPGMVGVYGVLPDGEVEDGAVLGGAGGLGMARPEYVHLAELGETDSRLGVAFTLMADSDSLLECYRGPGVASFELEWTISREGETREPRVGLNASPPVYGEAEGMTEILDSSRDCLAEVLSKTSWHRPGEGAPVEARVRVCLGMAE